ncbi:T9SS type A sorting domain-containing protein [Bacteroides sp. 214]|uniref:T9SS type A sorting domain-containing protein n=1 Tax=Bacteroides sp. 214 TaxID=2302935 RepID=UPI0013D1226F|nr:T9SS type A sorting domain-containing protein [Bacteroides sp. 214]
MKKSFLFVLAFLLHLGALSAQTKIPAFPTAEGYGIWVTGGRGGKVVAVTNLEDNATTPVEGSLRWALNQHSGHPLTIVFNVSGTIDLKGNNLKKQRNNLTIAGQTAPGDGICIRGGCVNLGKSRNVIIRHVRFRIGMGPEDSFVAGASLNIENGGEWIIDHCSFSWSAEENINFYDNDNTTLQWCLIAEGLYNAGHGKGNRGYGAVIGGKTATYHHNLIAHSVSRSPRYGATTKNDKHMLLDYVNNVHYNWGKSNAIYGGDNRQGTDGLFLINVVNNYYRPGPAYPGTSKSYLADASIWTSEPVQGRDQAFWHMSGNYIEGTHSLHPKINANNYEGLKLEKFQETYLDFTLTEIKSDKMFEVPYPVKTETAAEALVSVLAKVGAFPRDAVDTRVLHETNTGTATASSSFSGYKVTGIVDRPADSGGYPQLNTYNILTDTDKDGMPDEWETLNGLNPNDAEDRNRVTVSGYTALEVYLNSLCGEKIDLEFAPTSINHVEKDVEVSVRVVHDSLKVLSPQPPVQAYVYTLSGQLVATEVNGASSVDVSGLSSGFYVVELRFANKLTKNLKFFK